MKKLILIIGLVILGAFLIARGIEDNRDYSAQACFVTTGSVDCK